MIYYFGIAEHPISSGETSNTNCLIHPSSLQVLIHLNRYRDPKLQSLRVRRTYSIILATESSANFEWLDIPNNLPMAIHSNIKLASFNTLKKNAVMHS